MGDFKHVPVLLNEAIYCLNVQKGKKYIDATIGGGGHTREILRLGGIVLGIDVDSEPLNLIKENFKKEDQDERLILVKGDFSEIAEIAETYRFTKVSGILFDLGLSSWQIDQSKRGFSYQKDEYLDMRFDQKQKVQTAAEILDSANFKELSQIIAKFGEEENAEEVARIIIESRKRTPLATTLQLTRLLNEKFVFLPESRRIKLVARVYQALRIAVNDEIEKLKKGLNAAVNLLAKKGRLVIISFHSLEDRISKFALQNSKLKILTKSPIEPTNEEIRRNRRSRSAKLRAAEKI